MSYWVVIYFDSAKIGIFFEKSLKSGAKIIHHFENIAIFVAIFNNETYEEGIFIGAGHDAHSSRINRLQVFQAP